MATKTIDDIQPKAVMSPTEQGRWGTSNSRAVVWRSVMGLTAEKHGRAK
jgi:hypothetical protein